MLWTMHPVVADHDHHEDTLCAVAAWLRPGTRLFERRTLAPGRSCLHTFPATRFLGAGAAMLLRRYPNRTGRNRRRSRPERDGTAANEHRLPWQTRDRQALKVYRALAMSRAVGLERRGCAANHTAPLPGQPSCPVPHVFTRYPQRSTSVAEGVQDQ